MVVDEGAITARNLGDIDAFIEKVNEGRNRPRRGVSCEYGTRDKKNSDGVP